MRSFLGLTPRVTATVAALLLASHPAAAVQRIAVPSYFYPGPFPTPLWMQLDAGSPAVGLAIINPNSGPGPMADPNYVAQVAATQAAGITLIAYVYTSYAARSAAAVQADIDAYYLQYASIDGIFIDEVNSSCALQPYYAALDAYVKAKGGAGLTVLNPGIPVPDCYAGAADILLTFEGSYAQYLSFTPSGWETGYPESRFWHLVYATSESEMASAVALSQTRHAGWVYVTPDVLPNPWDTLPADPYWSSELLYVQAPSGGCLPAQKPRLAIAGLDDPPGEQRFTASAEAVFPALPAIDPLATGVRLLLHTAATTLLDVTIPPGAFADPPGYGWRVNRAGTQFIWKDDTEAIASGIVHVVIRDKSHRVPGLYTVKVKARDGAYPVAPSELPLSAQVLLDPTTPNGPCALLTFPGPAPGCALDRSGSKVTCR